MEELADWKVSRENRYAFRVFHYCRIWANCCWRDKNDGIVFFKAASPQVQRSRTLVEVRAQLVDGTEPHHAFGHLGLDRAVGIQRIGHAVDNA